MVLHFHPNRSCRVVKFFFMYWKAFQAQQKLTALHSLGLVSIVKQAWQFVISAFFHLKLDNDTVLLNVLRLSYSF